MVAAHGHPTVVYPDPFPFESGCRKVRSRTGQHAAGVHDPMPGQGCAAGQLRQHSPRLSRLTREARHGRQLAEGDDRARGYLCEHGQQGFRIECGFGHTSAATLKLRFFLLGATPRALSIHANPSRELSTSHVLGGLCWPTFGRFIPAYVLSPFVKALSTSRNRDQGSNP